MIAGDLPGMISGYLEERYQADGAVFLWTSGAAANQNPIFFSRYQRYEHDKTHGLSYSIGYGVWTLCRHLAETQAVDVIGVLENMGAVSYTHLPDMTENDRRKHKIANGFLYLAAVISYVLAGIQRVPLNSVWYIALLQSGVLLSLIWVTWPLYYYISSEKRMTVRIYKDSSLWLKGVSLGSACLLFGIVLTAGTAGLISGQGMPGKSISVLAGYLLSGISMLTIYLYERKISYFTEANTTKKPEKGVTIRY